MRHLLLLAGLGVLAGAVPAAAAVSHLGGFHSVADEKPARAVWVNPAAIGLSRLSSSLSELVWNDLSDEESENDVAPDGLRFASHSSGTPRAAVGFQWEFDDEEGFADWTLAYGKPIPLREGRLGSALEWRAGKKDKLDATIGSLFPFGRNFVGALVVQNVFEAEIDSVGTTRVWQGGAAFKSRKLLGRLTYDFLYSESSEVDTEHWFGVSIDRARRLGFSYAANTDGEWSGQVDVSRQNLLLGVGVLDREDRPRRIFFSLEWIPPDPRRGRPISR